ncbi:hypothetical protein MATL_G00064690 [Megalops atlanticus]|uniref:Uncharacterized protein n=1 Tax=Megalops atlanticus TaxID=7932 RepID=A0A9D3TAH7_MEGAT|nr:hypothetical protein MATL_G00064690 [Megalops atlanticus]
MWTDGRPQTPSCAVAPAHPASLQEEAAGKRSRREGLDSYRRCCWVPRHAGIAQSPQWHQMTRGQQRINLDDTFFCMKRVPVGMDPSVSLTAFPGSFLETPAQVDSEILGLRKLVVSQEVPHTQDLGPAGKRVSRVPSPQLRSETQFDRPLTVLPSPGEKPHGLGQTSPVESTPTTAKNMSEQQGGWGGRLGAEPGLGGGLELQDLRLLIQAHCEQLEEMESLCRREEALLSQQPSMNFTDYVLKLEEIMEQKAKCVRSVRAQLQLYLTCPCNAGAGTGSPTH